LEPEVLIALLGEVRGIGAIWGVDVRAGVSAVDVRDTMLDNGVVVRPIGTSTLAFCPPLVITDDELAEMVQVLRAALHEHATA
jgi:adenosylmethionine-8-amino-7-oxononanoate aminotransferase